MIAAEDVADTVRQVVFLMRVGNDDIDIDLELSEDPMPARFDRRLISQGLTNIIKNATEAIAAVPPAERGRGRIRVIAAREGDDIVIDVIDNGIGLPKENRNRLLEPYVTTREKGTGLGLAIVGRILEEHGGGIELRDAAEKYPGERGAWMRLRFMRRARGASAGAEAQRPPRRSRQSELEHRIEHMASDILIVDDEADICELVAGLLQDEGYATRTARDSDAALNEIKSRRPNLVFLDIWLQGSRLDGLQLLDSVKEQHPDMPVVMISGHGNIETAVAAIKRGAYDFIEKPFKADRLVLVADRALETSRLKREVKELKALTPVPISMVGRSPSINQLRQSVEKIAPTNSRIMIVGPVGRRQGACGARICMGCRRAPSGPFVVINAAAITPELMEVELFGVEQTNGTQQRKVGALEEAHGGTLFIDEIADMPRETQNKILRVLVDQTFQRVGGSTKVAVDVRIVSSTSRNIEAEIAAGRFREDLYHRLSVVPIRVPPLAERREDIPDLVDYFMDQISQTTGLPKRKIGGDAMAVLQSHDWPGNVRQLRNNVERLMILAGGEPDAVITASMLPQDVGSMVPAMPNGNGGEQLMGLPLREARELFEREYLLAQINRFGGNISRTAEFVGMERSALHRKLKALGIG